LKWMAEVMGVSLKTEQRRSHTAVTSFRPWVRRAEGYSGTCHLKAHMEVAVKPRRPPSLPLISIVFPAQFFVFCFERDLHGLFLRLFQKAKLLKMLQMVED
jgi:hypothetical protein